MKKTKVTIVTQKDRVLDLLKTQKTKMSPTEIAESLGLYSSGNISKSIKALCEEGKIKRHANFPQKNKVLYGVRGGVYKMKTNNLKKGYILWTDTIAKTAVLAGYNTNTKRGIFVDYRVWPFEYPMEYFFPTKKEALKYSEEQKQCK